MDEKDWPEVERRREINVTVAHLSNGVKKAAWAALGLLATGVISAIGWGIRTEIRDHRQDSAIEQNQKADRVIDRALSDGLRSLSRADSAFVVKLQEDEEERQDLLQRIIWLEAAVNQERRRR